MTSPFKNARFQRPHPITIILLLFQIAVIVVSLYYFNKFTKLLVSNSTQTKEDKINYLFKQNLCLASASMFLVGLVISSIGLFEKE